MSENNYDELLASAKEEIEAAATRRLELLAEIGAKALPELRHKPGYTELTAQFDESETKADELRLRIDKLQEERALFELKEKERLARYTCPKCGKINSEDARFCEECGEKVGELPREFCRNCGTMNLQGMKFCGECGTKLDEVAAL